VISIGSPLRPMIQPVSTGPRVANPSGWALMVASSGRTAVPASWQAAAMASAANAANGRN
jgi:hypothetical protein